nr:CMP dCMP deaminase domain containing protein [Haemonchus contortus]
MEAHALSSNGVDQARPEDNDSIVDGLKDVMIQEGTASGKRKDYLSWENYFMAVAKLASMRSKDPNTQVGCAIVNRENKIIGTGYNGRFHTFKSLVIAIHEKMYSKDR